MTCTVMGFFERIEDAGRAVKELEQVGITRDNVSVVAGQESATALSTSATSHNVDSDEEAIGAGKGAVVGGLTGLLVGVGALLIPGIGPVMAVGPLSAALGTAVGAASGAVTAPLLDALLDAGVPEGDAEVFAEGVRRGGTLLSVEVGDEYAEEVERIMEHNGASDIEERARSWSSDGWRSGVNPTRENDGTYDSHTNGSGDIAAASESLAGYDSSIYSSPSSPPSSARRYGRYPQ